MDDEEEAELRQADDDAKALMGSTLLLLCGVLEAGDPETMLAVLEAEEHRSAEEIAQRIVQSPERAVDVLLALAHQGATLYVVHAKVLGKDPIEMFRSHALRRAERHANEIGEDDGSGDGEMGGQ